MPSITSPTQTTTAPDNFTDPESGTLTTSVAVSGSDPLGASLSNTTPDNFTDPETIAFTATAPTAGTDPLAASATATAPAGFTDPQSGALSGAGATAASDYLGTAQTTTAPTGFTDPESGTLTSSVPDISTLSQAPALSDNMLTPSLYNAGLLTLNQIFGYFKVPMISSLIAVNVSAQEAPVGSSCTIGLVDGSGNPILDSTATPVTISLTAGSTVNQVTLANPVALAAGAVIQGKVTAVGSTSAGGYVTITPVLRALS